MYLIYYHEVTESELLVVYQNNEYGGEGFRRYTVHLHTALIIIKMDLVRTAYSLARKSNLKLLKLERSASIPYATGAFALYRQLAFIAIQELRHYSY